MKRWKKALFGAGLGVCTLTAGVAWAGSWSVYFPIEYLSTSTVGYNVYVVAGTVPNNSQNDPANCVPSGSPITAFHQDSGASTAERELMDKTLLAAFLANRRVELDIVTTAGACVSGMPVYSGVGMNRNQ